jgi:hypothetical protein
VTVQLPPLGLPLRNDGVEQVFADAAPADSTSRTAAEKTAAMIIFI